MAALLVASLGRAPERTYSPHQRHFFASETPLRFVRPGLTIVINSAKIASDGTISAVYTLSDPNGLPLDTSGVNTPGTISLSFVAAVLPNGQEDYTAYTTRAATGTVIASAQQ